MVAITNDQRFLDSARSMADEAIEKLFVNGLLKGHPAKPYYEAVDGVGYLLYALVQLDRVIYQLNNTDRHEHEIDLNIFGMGLDNW
jgi:hypothetical protein